MPSKPSGTAAGKGKVPRKTLERIVGPDADEEAQAERRRGKECRCGVWVGIGL